MASAPRRAATGYRSPIIADPGQGSRIALAETEETLVELDVMFLLSYDMRKPSDTPLGCDMVAIRYPVAARPSALATG